MQIEYIPLDDSLLRAMQRERVVSKRWRYLEYNLHLCD
jgi:hypothetical protein